MKRATNFLTGFIIGGVLAGAIVLLLTPTSGDELRAQAQQRIAALQQEIQQAAAARRAELEAQLAALRATPAGQNTPLTD